MNSLMQLIPAFLVLFVCGLIFFATKVLIAHYKLKKRRSPFIGNFLRSPGESLRRQLDELTIDLNVNLTSTFIVPFLLYSIIVTHAYFGGNDISMASMLLFIFIAAVFEAYFITKLVKVFSRRRKLRLGYEGEIAVGQKLNQLLRDGYEVYHDFPAEKFNIDHVVVGPTGVYAVETKARQKPTTGNGKSDARVVYDGQKLQFPDWAETKPIEQTRRQAQWLSKWLSSAVGDQVHVQPVIALPGWFVERTSSKGFPVINPKNLRAILKPNKNKLLDKSAVTRIVHQIDQRCRDVRPRAAEGLGGKPGISD